MKHVLGWGALAALSCGLVAACDAPREVREEQGKARTGANEASITAITQARCEREQRCNNVGADKKFRDTAHCTTDIGKDIRDDLSADDCPGGVDQKELTECLAEIRSEDCNNPLDKLERVTACRESDLCKATPRM